MKTPEQLLKEKGITPETMHHNYDYVYRAVCKIIEQAQREAYNQALDDKLDANKIHIMLSGIKIDNDNLDYIKLTGEICGNLRWDLVEAIKNLKK